MFREPEQDDLPPLLPNLVTGGLPASFTPPVTGSLPASFTPPVTGNLPAPPPLTTVKLPTVIPAETRRARRNRGEEPSASGRRRKIIFPGVLLGIVLVITFATLLSAPLNSGQNGQQAQSLGQSVISLITNGQSTHSTGNIIPANSGPVISVRTLLEGSTSEAPPPLNGLFTGAIEATEEAVYNALVAAETTTGVNGSVLEAIPHDRLRAILNSDRALS